MNDKDLKELMRINMDMVEMLDNSMARLLNAGEDESPTVDPYAELKAADAAGKAIQFYYSVNGGWIDGNVGYWAWSLPPEHYRIKPEPELYSGLTLEQWEVVIDGEFLCEFSQNGHGEPRFVSGEPLENVCSVSERPYRSASGVKWLHCRPLRKVGVIQPMLDSDECRDQSSNSMHAELFGTQKGFFDEWHIYSRRNVNLKASKIDSLIVLP